MAKASPIRFFICSLNYKTPFSFSRFLQWVHGVYIHAEHMAPERRPAMMQAWADRLECFSKKSKLNAAKKYIRNADTKGSPIFRRFVMKKVAAIIALTIVSFQAQAGVIEDQVAVIGHQVQADQVNAQEFCHSFPGLIEEGQKQAKEGERSLEELNQASIDEMKSLNLPIMRVALLSTFVDGALRIGYEHPEQETSDLIEMFDYACPAALKELAFEGVVFE